MIDYIPSGDHYGRAVNERQLHDELEAAGISVGGVGLIKNGEAVNLSIRIHLAQEPNAETKGAIDEVLVKHAPLPAANQPLVHQRLEELRTKRREGKALTTAEKQELLDIIAGV